MATAKQALIQVEAGQTLVTYESLTDSGDSTVFNPSASVMSGKNEVVVRPNGVVTGINLVGTDTTNDTVAVAAFTAYSKGVLQAVGAEDVTITRPSTDKAKVCSVTMTDAGALAVIAGTDGASTSFVETRGAAGGPPFIPVDSVEIAQVRVATSSAGVVDAAEILQNGQYTERADFPVYAVNNIGFGDNSLVAGKVNAFIEFNAALEPSHTGDTPKRVYCQYYVPSFSDVAKGSGFVPAETSHSVSSEEYYGGTIASSSESLGQASFTAMLEDGVTDPLVALKNTVVTVKVFPNRNKSAYMLQQGTFGIGRTFPVDGQISASVTVTAEVQTAEFAG